MDLAFKPEELAFRDEVRAFIRDKYPQEIRARARKGWSYLPKEDHIRWQKLLYDRGWIAPHWPKEYGGTGWTARQKFIFEEECMAAGCPRLIPFGLTMVGPVIYTFGSQAQKDRFLPPILRSDEWWCQGYSEPGSGSDLASLQTKAVKEGNQYRVNGSKIWTSGAHKADWMFCLVRTKADVKAQEGISFLLIDMKSPGISVKPIVSIDEGHYLNQVFIDDVMVPVENLVGEENKGWTYAKFLLGYERTGIAGVGRSKMRLEMLKGIARAEHMDGTPLIQDPGFQTRLAQIESDLMALEITNLRVMASSGAGGGSLASLLKIRGTEIEQSINQTLVDALGNYGVPYDVNFPRAESNEPPAGPDYAIGLAAENLLKRAASIYGGTNEIQRNIIAKMVLAL
ncbi:acyl-CoA dehydrogenase family protein [Desertibaculum subflavum]|uniref:acyl-CoA dehydrogenase family protein n=1 Tax=Desertibaculum subflavum TaxID=2268458 RepID=UPI000E660F3A